MLIVTTAALQTCLAFTTVGNPSISFAQSHHSYRVSAEPKFASHVISPEKKKQQFHTGTELQMAAAVPAIKVGVSALAGVIGGGFAAGGLHAVAGTMFNAFRYYFAAFSNPVYHLTLIFLVHSSSAFLRTRPSCGAFTAVLRTKMV
jgi:hypothetical protein